MATTSRGTAMGRPSWVACWGLSSYCAWRFHSVEPWCGRHPSAGLPAQVTEPDGGSPHDGSARRRGRGSAAWHAHLARARAHLAEHPDFTTAEPELARWGDRQIHDLRANRTSDEHRELLRAAGITDRTPTTAEATFLGELDWWVRQRGDADVPQMATTPRRIRGRPYWLGKRVSEARIAHGRGTLSPVLEEELPKRPGWSWRTLEARWDAS